MKYLIYIVLFFNSSYSLAEIYDSDSEYHEQVTTCRGYSPFYLNQGVHLNRNSFLESVDLEETIRYLLTLDANEKSEAARYEPPKDLHPSEGTREESILTAYKSAFSYKVIAECLVNNYKMGDEIWLFENKAIQPNRQKGYVIIRRGALVVRAITESLYID